MVAYINGCGSCGRIGRKLRDVLRYCKDNGLGLHVKYSGNDPEHRAQHLQKLKEAGLPLEVLTAIIIDDNGKIMRLTEWNS